MFGYIQYYYMQQAYGRSYIPTQLILLAGIVLVFWPVRERTLQELFRFAGRLLAIWLLNLFLDTLYFNVVGESNLDFAVLGILVLIGILLSRDAEPLLRTVRGMVFMASYYQMLTISYETGSVLDTLAGAGRPWTRHISWILILLMLSLTVFLINRWAVRSILYTPPVVAYLTIMVSALGIILQTLGNYLEVSRVFQFVVCASLYLLQLVSYFLFYMVSTEEQKNMEMVELAGKEKLDREVLAHIQENMDTLHELRHEIKNHMAYIRVLVAREEYEKLFAYTNQVLNDNEQLMQTVASGNALVDVVLSHAIQKGKQMGIAFDMQNVVVPAALPFRDTDFCSILSNLTDNALEAAMKSGEENPVIELQILPRQDYLFIHITNPVGNQYSSSRILSLITTKEDRKTHGFGTKIITKFVEKYDGSIQYDIRDSRFIADVMLDMNSMNEKQEEMD